MRLRIAYFQLFLWILVGTFGIIFVDNSRADASEQALYNARGKRDPFVQLITLSSRVSAGLMGVENLDEITIEGIIYDAAKGSVVIANGSVLKEGEELGNVKVIEIRPEGAIFSVNGIEGYKAMYSNENKDPNETTL